jgi:RimJ/RimL family protein N-acetyltransferase
LQNEFSHLENFVDARNARSIRWLRRLGFSIREPRRMGLSDVTFYRFEMGA